ncbi:MAG: hypothetical protein IKQ71_11080 [Lachnospiraceae bacterium]|nr:hypothetical protein [Lachnospiraceae bacterium]
MKIRDYIEFGAEKLANNAFRTMLGMLLSLIAFIVMVIGLFYYYSGNVGSFLADMFFDVEAGKMSCSVGDFCCYRNTDLCSSFCLAVKAKSGITYP